MSGRDERFIGAREKFFDALTRLEEALAVPSTAPLALDGTIQRFEFTVEMAWRALKYAAALQLIETVSPRQALEAGAALGLIEDDGGWVAMLQDRNETSHSYKQSLAEALYARLPGHVLRMQALRTALAGIRS